MLLKHNHRLLVLLNSLCALHRTPWDDPDAATAVPAAAAAASAAAPPVAPTATAGFVAVPQMPASIARRRAAFEMEQAQALLKKQQVSIRCTLECRDIPAFPARRSRESDDPVAL